MDLSNKFEGPRDWPWEAAMLEPLQMVVPVALDSRANLALLALAEKPYWTRAWIYQELTLAKIGCDSIWKGSNNPELLSQNTSRAAFVWSACYSG